MTALFPHVAATFPATITDMIARDAQLAAEAAALHASAELDWCELRAVGDRAIPWVVAEALAA